MEGKNDIVGPNKILVAIITLFICTYTKSFDSWQSSKTVAHTYIALVFRCCKRMIGCISTVTLSIVSR